MESLDTTVKSVSEIMEAFENGSIAIPEIQRDVVWKADQVKDLIDSIGREYPCGALIYWEPREKDEQLVKSMIRPERLEQHDGRLPRYFLLDGQQRVTALASVLLKREKLRDLLSEMEEDMPLLFANLRRFPKEIEATTDIGGYKFPWVLYNKLFDGSLQQEPEYALLTPEQREGIRRYTQHIRDYKFPVQIIKDQKYETVGEIFTRVNSQGTQLTGAEIYMARIVPHWHGITREFRDYRRELRQKNYELDLTFLMRAIAVVECASPNLKKLADRISKERPSRKRLNATWKTAKRATDRLIGMLRKELLLDKSKFFTSRNALVPLVYSYASTPSPSLKNVKRFFLLSQLSEHYGAAAETTLRKDFRALTDPAVNPRRGLEDLVGNIDREARQYFRGLKIKPTDVKGPASKNVRLLLMYILMRKRSATDWGKGEILKLQDIDPKNTQLHHIFPFNFMVKNQSALKQYTDDDLTPADYRADINDIANFTFISQSRNGSIGDAPPWEYLPKETTREMRKAHFIPENPELWQAERFQDFIEERRRLLSKAMTTLIRRL